MTTATATTMTTTTALIAEPVELNGQHWVVVKKDNREKKRRGPFANANAAQAAADRLLERRRVRMAKPRRKVRSGSVRVMNR